MLVSFRGSESLTYSVSLDVEGSLVAVKTISDSSEREREGEGEGEGEGGCMVVHVA